MICTYSISVIGAGSYGTALSIALSRNGCSVLLWGHNYKHLINLQSSRCNSTYLPHIYFPKNLIIEYDLSKIINASKDLLVVVPSNVFGNVLSKIKPYLRIDSRLIWATKGLENGTGRLLQDVAREILGSKIPLAIITGPSFSRELAKGLPTSMVLSATDINFSKDLQHKFYHKNFLYIYITSDFIGLQLCGVIKNIIAIGAGIFDGIGLGGNARSVLISHWLEEMTRLGIALGANQRTFMGIAGLGDIILTCTDNKSRNRRFGLMIGKGKNINIAQSLIGKVIEGYENIKNIKMLAARVGIEIPITEEIYQILYCKKSAQNAAINILNDARCLYI